VAIVNSTIARNAAVAHVGGGVWARDDLYVANSTISNNYAEGQGGGIAAGGDVALVHTTILDNQSPVAANIGAGGRLDAFASIIGPAQTQPGGAPGHPTDVNCMPAGGARSFGWNFVFDHSCGLGAPTDMTATGDPMLAPLHQNGGLGETRAPVPGSPVVDRLPADACRFAGLADPVAGNPKAAGLLADAATREAHDQRGAVRPMGAGCDIGAVELDR
jgi:predicted outer membrane repeat protein